MGTLTLEEKELWKQYSRIARMEAEKFLPVRENLYSEEELRVKERENWELYLRDKGTMGTSEKDVDCLKFARETRMREERWRIREALQKAEANQRRETAVVKPAPKPLHPVLKFLLAAVCIAVMFAWRIFLAKHS